MIPVGNKAPSWRIAPKLLFWGSLVVAIAFVSQFFRYSTPPDALRITRMQTKEGLRPVPIRISMRGRAASIETMQAEATLSSAPQVPWAFMAASVEPYYDLAVNGVPLHDSSPERGYWRVRELGPTLRTIPSHLMHEGRNVFMLTVPANSSSGDVRISHPYVGRHEALAEAHSANWWKTVGISRALCFAMLALLLMTLLLWTATPKENIYGWYIGFLVLTAFAMLINAVAIRPGAQWMWVVGQGVAASCMPFALFGLLRALWRVEVKWVRWMTIATIWSLIPSFANFFLTPIQVVSGKPAVGLFFVIMAVIAALTTLGITHRLRGMLHTEHRVVQWATLFGLAVSCLDYYSNFVSEDRQWVNVAPLGYFVFALGIGYMLVSRLLMGARIYGQATQMVAYELDRELRAASLVDEVRVVAEERERSRVMRDLHDAFGARLVTVLAMIRQLPEDADLQVEVQRALLEMRLMVDAMDTSTADLQTALGRFRYRITPMLKEAGVEVTWKLDGWMERGFGSRERVVCLFRCLESLFHYAVLKQRDAKWAVSTEGSESGRHLNIVMKMDSDHAAMIHLPADVAEHIRRWGSDWMRLGAGSVELRFRLQDHFA